MTLTYNGTTAGSTLANPPVLMAAAIGGRSNWVTSGSTAAVNTYGSGAKIWFYTSSNSADELITIGCIGDGPALGMTLGDILVGVITTAGSTAAKSHFTVLSSPMTSLTSPLMTSTLLRISSKSLFLATIRYSPI